MARRYVGWSLAVMLFCACTPSRSLTTNTDSQSLPDKQARLAFLARYLRSKSPIVDAEYVIRYQDNSGGMIPGPSDWDIRAVLQVEGQTSVWHAGWAPCPTQGPSDAGPPGVDTTWAEPLLGRRAQWQTRRSSPRCYRSAHSVVLVYEEDNLVVYRNTSG